jgi:MATE family multidrug resistance protein
MVSSHMSVPQSSTGHSSHPFRQHPHRTLVTLALPVMASLVVEPFANLVDTAFIERLGAAPAAGLGAATILLSGTVWLFHFLGVGSQTEVAQALGAEGDARAGSIASLGLTLALLLGLSTALLVWPLVGVVAEWMSTDQAVQTATGVYLKIRLIGAPATLVVLAMFGVLRGLQDMQTPLWIAGGMSVFNIVLDPLLIFGLGPVPGFGIAGAAWATTLSQILGAVWSVQVIARRVPLSAQVEWQRARRFLAVGRDLALRTAASLAFMLAGMWTALHISVEAGAAHQALRQVWMLLAFLLDAFALTAQSLIGFYIGAADLALARQVARVASLWALAIGSILAVFLLALETPIAIILVPPDARVLFGMGWVICAVSQPINAVAFVTDGIHWGTGDFAYLRNAMLIATCIGVGLFTQIEASQPHAFTQVWLVMVVWTVIRAGFGVVRVWPGIGNALLRAPASF